MPEEETIKRLSPWVYAGIANRDKLKALNAFTSLSVDLSQFIDVCVLAFDVDRDEMFGRSRAHDCVLARHAFSKIAKESTSMTYTAIGKFLGRDHATILHSCKTADNYIETYPYFKDRYDICVKLLKKLEVVKEAGDLAKLASRIELIKQRNGD